MVFQIKSSFVAVQNHHRMGLQDGAPMDRQPSATPSTASVERNHSGALQAAGAVAAARVLGCEKT